MDDHQPVTEAVLKADLSALKAELLDAMRGMLHDMETKLLLAFFQHQEHAEIKFRRLSADVSNINATSDQRINNLEQRVIDIEKRLLMGGDPQ
jgi:hypothetical protein